MSAPALAPDLPRWLLVAEIAQLARVHPQTVYRHIRSSRLRAHQFAVGGTWRASGADVQAWLTDTRRSDALARRRTAV